MPEGDTIHRAAARMRPVLVGRPLVRFEARRLPPPQPAPGTVVESVEANGKHLLIGFADGWVLQTHMRMTGSWHLYRPGERWRKGPHLARAVVEVGPDPAGGDQEGWVAVCFSAPVVELVRRPRTDHLGPDLCRPDADLTETVRRMAALEPSTPLAEVLLD
jgi:endonuclease VIII